MLPLVITIALASAVTATPLAKVYSKTNRGPPYAVDQLSLDDYDLGQLRHFGDLYADNYISPKKAQLTDPDAKLNASEIIHRWGYPVENHLVQTKDGYILEIQRIPHGANASAPSGPRRVAYLQHGLLSSSFDFVCNPPEESLGFIMADKGYDVWIGNVRGNTYGKRHVNMTPSEKEFWNFTFDEFLSIDVPAIIDYILGHTGEESLYYVGHSQGTKVMFGLLATQLEYQKKVKAYVALAPVANVTTITSPIRWLAPFSHDLGWIVEWLGTGELLSNSKLMKFLAATVCHLAVTRELCEDVIFVVVGIDSKQLNVTRIPVYVAHTPAGTSVMNLVHYGQEVEAKRFQMYDFGASENQKRYHQATPPEYDIRNIRETPTAIYSSKNDWLADPADVDYIRKNLPSLVHDYKVSEDQFTHLDFLIGIRARQLVYDDVLNFLANY